MIWDYAQREMVARLLAFGSLAAFVWVAVLGSLRAFVRLERWLRADSMAFFHRRSWLVAALWCGWFVGLFLLIRDVHEWSDPWTLTLYRWLSP